ncbi:hypothetical protein SAMN05421866_3029 [Chryseobacterium oranimense]|uniref:Uncharacterized protein n=2 Tax=Chryseobacterium oranimense TaxID=421058 RepID=A0A1M5TMF3_9FLAO|nr:hypothetical protein SAMN05421866_3029 [Chryseobacterium oranimense]
MLSLLGIGLFDLINREDFSLQSYGDKLTIIVVAILFLLKLISLIFILFKLSKSILLLNIYYISSLSILVVSTAINELYSAINLFLIFCLSILIFLVNKFKYKKVHYENIELIGTQND